MNPFDYGERVCSPDLCLHDLRVLCTRVEFASGGDPGGRDENDDRFSDGASLVTIAICTHCADLF